MNCFEASAFIYFQFYILDKIKFYLVKYLTDVVELIDVTGDNKLALMFH